MFGGVRFNELSAHDWTATRVRMIVKALRNLSSSEGAWRKLVWSSAGSLVPGSH